MLGWVGGSLVLTPSPASPFSAGQTATGALEHGMGGVGEGVGRIEDFKIASRATS